MHKIGAMNPRLLAMSLLAAHGAGGAAAGQTPPPAVPVEPIAAILAAFERHAIVAIGDPHGNEQAHEFRLALVRDPRFAETVDDIVVEWGNALYQDVADRFVDGGDVSDAELRQVWRNTTQPGLGNDRPITGAFFRAVREVNAALLLRAPAPRAARRPPDRLGRGGDAGGPSEVAPAPRHLPGVVDSTRGARRGEGAPSSSTAPCTCSGGTCSPTTSSSKTRTSTRSSSSSSAGASRARSSSGRRWGSTCRRFSGTRRRGPRPASRRCAAPCWGRRTSRRSPPTDPPRATFRDGRIVPIPRDEWRSLPAEEQFDAALYLGPLSRMTRSLLSPSLCRDAAYMEMRRERLSLLGMQRDLEQLRSYCARVAP